MSVAVQLTGEVATRLTAVAARRGLSIDQVAAEVLAEHLPSATGHRLRFVGIGASDRTGPLDLARERSELAARKLAEIF